MADDINSVTIVGRLTRDAELKYTNNGSAVTKLSLAVNRSRKDGDQWVEEANFFDVSLWGKRGESLNQYLQKGTKIAVSGELRQDKWEQDGQSRSRVFIFANNIQLLGSNSSGQSNQNYSGNNQKNSYNNGYNNQSNNFNNKPSYENYPSGNQGGNGNFEDDIPF
ncbi:MAG: single-stranded DNA-binding protein [Spirochaetales bacterium]|nr:single-stranded DNA-binding protein [Spirochaetales bacterium]